MDERDDLLQSKREKEISFNMEKACIRKSIK